MGNTITHGDITTLGDTTGHQGMGNNITHGDITTLGDTLTPWDTIVGVTATHGDVGRWDVSVAWTRVIRQREC